MTNIILSSILILAFTISTVLTVLFKPAIYKQVIFAPKSIEVVQNTSEIPEKEIQIKEIKPIEQKRENIEISNNTKVEKIEKTLKPVKKQEINETKTIKSPKLPSSIQKITKEPIEEKNSEEILVKKQAENKKEIVKTEKPAKIDSAPPAPIEQPTRQLTEQEELIIWNRWRSNLQNKVMRDVKINAPLGTRFRFSFTVDKYGQISNLKVWSDNPEYTSLAVSRIKPLLLSYQGQPILNFPQGTKRIVTNVTGGFVLATFDKYSKPSDYSDVERVKYMR